MRKPYSISTMTLKELGKGKHKVKFQDEIWSCTYVGDHHAGSCWNDRASISIDEDKEVEVVG